VKNSAIAERVVNEQIDAYNRCHLDDFLATYAPDVDICDGATGELLMKGHAGMRDRYEARFNTSPKLHAHIVNRIVMGSLVIDYERVTGIGEENRTNECAAIYKVSQGLITQVWFFDNPINTEDATDE